MAYSKKEKLVADLMSYLPWLKPLAKRTYQHINFLLNKPSSSFETSYKLHELGETNKESFFGYYDKSPLNINGEYAIYQQTTHTTTQKPSAEKAIEVVLFHMPTQKMMKSWPTHAYNLQQGAKPMWLDEQRFSFNYFDTEQNSYGAQIIDISETHFCKILKTPLYDAQANTGLSLSFERLNKIMPDYGYRI